VFPWLRSIVLRLLLSGLIDWTIAALFVAGGLGRRR
jgi:hypothetical protein